MLHFRRKRLRKIADQEASGQTFWTTEFDIATRNKILLAFQDATGDTYGLQTAADAARGLIMRDEGVLFLTSKSASVDSDLLNFLLQCNNSIVPTVIEAMSSVCNDQGWQSHTGSWAAGQGFDSQVSVTLREHQISFELVDHQMVEFSSRELHQNVVVPTLSLLAGRSDLASVESAYQDALQEISKGKPGDAITDAGTALQECLVAMGCSGNALGPLLKSAREKGLIAAHDARLEEGILKFADWASAERSQRGDAHTTSTASVVDAWLMVHVVGALILRLVEPESRAT